MNATRRRRLAGVGALVCLLSLAPAAAQARKHAGPNGHNISINLSDNPVTAGDQVVIFGRLTGPNNAGRVVTLWHRINPRPAFTPVQQTKTDGQGFYAFFRQPGVVDSNRNWYVKSLGARSRNGARAGVLAGDPERAGGRVEPAHGTGAQGHLHGHGRRPSRWVTGCCSSGRTRTPARAGERSTAAACSPAAASRSPTPSACPAMPTSACSCRARGATSPASRTSSTTRSRRRRTRS